MNFRLLILLLAVLLPAGCGYHHPASKLAAGNAALSVHAGTWDNRTNELRLAGLLLQKTGDWLQQSHLLRLESDPAQADYILNGTIEAVSFPAAAFSSSDRATTLRAWIRVSYRLTAREGNRVVWEINDAVRERDFPAGIDAVMNRSSKEEALAVIADELAEQIYLKVLATIGDLPPEAKQQP